MNDARFFPAVKTAEVLTGGHLRRLYVGAYGYESRSLAWGHLQNENDNAISDAIVARYVLDRKGRNKIRQLQKILLAMGAKTIDELRYEVQSPHDIESSFGNMLRGKLPDVEEVIVDISAMTKLLILVTLCQLKDFERSVRIVYSEAQEYAPTKADYEKSKEDIKLLTRFPSIGVESIVRTKCLSSIRMQGQPVTLVAFTSFNEQLIRHMLGTMSPYRLVFIGCRPPRREFAWREYATQEIHKPLIADYNRDNPIDKENGLLLRSASTLDYIETLKTLESIYLECGLHERIICAATGSKMQTVGLFFHKMSHPDVHIEYPTPESHYLKSTGTRIQRVHEVLVPEFKKFLTSLCLLDTEGLSRG